MQFWQTLKSRERFCRWHSVVSNYSIYSVPTGFYAQLDFKLAMMVRSYWGSSAWSRFSQSAFPGRWQHVCGGKELVIPALGLCQTIYEVSIAIFCGKNVLLIVVYCPQTLYCLGNLPDKYLAAIKRTHIYFEYASGRHYEGVWSLKDWKLSVTGYSSKLRKAYTDRIYPVPKFKHIWMGSSRALSPTSQAIQLSG